MSLTHKIRASLLLSIKSLPQYDGTVYHNHFGSLSLTCLHILDHSIHHWASTGPLKRKHAYVPLAFEILIASSDIASVVVGAHTLGAARCSSFKHRLSKFDSTHDVDPSLDSNLATMMSRTCSQGDNASMPLDWTTNSFDNAYFNALQMGMGLLFSDQALTTDPKTQGFVNAFAMNQAMFFYNFQQAMVKMGLLDIKEGDQGEIRQSCRKVN